MSDSNTDGAREAVQRYEAAVEEWDRAHPEWWLRPGLTMEGRQALERARDEHGRRAYRQEAVTYDPQSDIDLSVREDRIVTLYPDTREEEDAIVAALLAEAVDSADGASGDGYSAAEARGWAKYWGFDEMGYPWLIRVVHAPEEEGGR